MRADVLILLKELNVKFERQNRSLEDVEFNQINFKKGFFDSQI